MVQVIHSALAVPCRPLSIGSATVQVRYASHPAHPALVRRVE
jgi:hypothetical protein